MDFNISQTLEDVKGAMLRSAVAMLITNIIMFVFMPKSTTVQIDEGIPTELYTLGKKGNPKMVYISTKKHSVHIAPVVAALVVALAAGFLKKVLDDKNPPSTIE